MRLVTGAVLVALAAGCTTSAPPPSSPAPAPSVVASAAAGLPLTVRRTGGLAGVDQTLTVNADGSWTYGDGRQATRQTGQLTAAQRFQLQRLLASPALLDEVRSGRSANPECADGFQYTLTFDRITVTRTDCGDLDGPTLTEIVTLLSKATPF